MKKKPNYLEEEIKDIQEKLTALEPGDEERAVLLDELKQLYEIKNGDTKAKSQIVDPILRTGGQVLIGIAGLIAYNAWYRRGLKFEIEGTVTSSMTRQLLSKMAPKLFG